MRKKEGVSHQWMWGSDHSSAGWTAREETDLWISTVIHSMSRPLEGVMIIRILANTTYNTNLGEYMNMHFLFFFQLLNGWNFPQNTKKYVYFCLLYQQTISLSKYDHVILFYFQEKNKFKKNFLKFLQWVSH